MDLQQLLRGRVPPVVVPVPEPVLELARRECPKKRKPLEPQLRHVERVGVDRVRQSAKLRIREEQHGERHKIDDVTPSPSEHDRSGEEDHQRAVGRPVEAEAPGADRGAEDDRGDDRELRAGVMSARAGPQSRSRLASRARCSLRLPFLGLPLTADEGGYAEIARLWSTATGSTAELFVDRPQGLLLVYRVLLDLGADSTVAFAARPRAWASPPCLRSQPSPRAWAGG